MSPLNLLRLTRSGNLVSQFHLLRFRPTIHPATTLQVVYGFRGKPLKNPLNVLKQFKLSKKQKELEKDKILNQREKMLSRANMKELKRIYSIFLILLIKN